MSSRLRSVCGSFKAAFAGMRYCVRNERNMRIHLTIALGVVLLSVFYDFPPADWGLLLLLFGTVISAEMFNTAIERVVDLLSPSYNNLAKLAKDIAAGAVLVCAIAAVGVGALLFSSPAGLKNLLGFLTAHPLIAVLEVAAYCCLAAGFIFLPEKR